MISIKNKILIAIVLSLLITIVSVIFVILKNSEPEITKDPIKHVSDIVSTSTHVISKSLDGIIRQTAIAEPLTEDKCNFQDPELKEKCLNQIIANKASLDDDISVCLDVDDYKLRSDCIFDGVREFYSVRECRRIPDHYLVGVCIQGASIETKYIEFCDVFNGEPHEKQECLDRTKAFIIADEGDINKCGDLDVLEYEGLCRAMTLKNTQGTCENIKDRRDRDVCISEILFEAASTREKCNVIPDLNYKKVCLEIYDNKENEDYNFDTDGDGLTHFQELWLNTDPFSQDSDGDGLSDYQEIVEKIGGNPLNADTDQDGLPDGEEVKLGTSVQRPDTDGDGVWDSVDKDPLSGDSDNDRLDDATEALWGTDPNNRDTDGDGLSDYDEVKNGKNPLGEGWKSDTDGDGLLDIDEIFYLTDPLDPDTDGDGVSDKDEIEAGTNPLGEGDFDFDGDRLSDKKELELGTNPYKSDTNGDWISDFEAVRRKIDPISNDTDGDGLSNSYELRNNTDPVKSDTDGDGLSDGDEINKYGTDPNNIDTDGDGFLDGEEVQAGFDPRVASGV